MKKFLFVVPVMVMVMFLVTMSVGAKDFADSSTFTYVEAVNAISEIGVVDGYTDGTFNPANDLTRGAAAKIICNLILGPTTANALSADVAPYRDVPTTHEFAGYISYCQQQGIISGYADGTFRPAAPLTGYAFMKMLLGALGYDSEIEGFTGTNWSVNVGKLALGINLHSGFDGAFSGVEAINREEACLFAFNTLKATMVEYDSKLTANVSGAGVTITNPTARSIAQAGYDNVYAGKGETLEFSERFFSNLTQSRNTIDAFGRPAVEWKYRSNVIGSYADDSNLVGTYTDAVGKNELYSLIGSSIVSDLGKANLAGYDLTVYVDGKRYELDNSQVSNFFDNNSNATAGLTSETNLNTGNQSTGRGVLTEVYLDDDCNVTIVMVNTYLMQATSDYNTARKTVSVEQLKINDTMSLPGLPAVLEQEDFDVADVKEGDYLLVTYSYATESIESVAVAEITTGTVSQYTENSNVVIDGTTYRYAWITGSNVRGETFTVNSDASLVMDPYGYIIYVDDPLVTDNLVYVKEFMGSSDLSFDGAVARAFFTESKEELINVVKVGSTTGRKIASLTAGSDRIVLANTNANWYSYTVDSDDSYTLTPIDSDSSGQALNNSSDADTKIVTNSNVIFTNLSTTVRANSGTVFALLDANENISVYTGVEAVPDISLRPGVVSEKVKLSWVTRGKYAEAVFIDASLLNENEVIIDDDTDDGLLFVLKSADNRTTVAGSTYAECDVVLNGEETSHNISLDLSASVGRLYYSYKTNSNNYIISASEANEGRREKIIMSGATISRSGQTLTITNNNKSSDYIITADTNINVIINQGVSALLKDDFKDYETYLNTTLGTLADLVGEYTVSGNAYVIVDEQGSEQAETVYIWINSADSRSPSSDDSDPEEDNPGVTSPLGTFVDMEAMTVETRVVYGTPDNTIIDNLLSAMSENGVEIVNIFKDTESGSNEFVTNWVLADNDDNTYAGTSREYYTVTVNDTVVEYVERNAATVYTTRAVDETAAGKSGTGYIWNTAAGGSTYYYAPYGSNNLRSGAVISGNIDVNYGYVKLTAEGFTAAQLNNSPWAVGYAAYNYSPDVPSGTRGTGVRVSGTNAYVKYGNNVPATGKDITITAGYIGITGLKSSYLTKLSVVWTVNGNTVTGNTAAVRFGDDVSVQAAVTVVSSDYVGEATIYAMVNNEPDYDSNFDLSGVTDAEVGSDTPVDADYGELIISEYGRIRLNESFTVNFATQTAETDLEYAFTNTAIPS